MARAVRDLWPDDIGRVDLVSPLAILEDQARALETRTGHKVRARVSSVGVRDTFTHTFYVELPEMQYEYELFRVKHGIGFYPLDIFSRSYPDGQYTAASEEEFIDGLRELFAAEQTKEVIKSLVALT
jgi:hypothetical protein